MSSDSADLYIWGIGVDDRTCLGYKYHSLVAKFKPLDDIHHEVLYILGIWYFLSDPYQHHLLVFGQQAWNENGNIFAPLRCHEQYFEAGNSRTKTFLVGFTNRWHERGNKLRNAFRPCTSGDDMVISWSIFE